VCLSLPLLRLPDQLALHLVQLVKEGLLRPIHVGWPSCAPELARGPPACVCALRERSMRAHTHSVGAAGREQQSACFRHRCVLRWWALLLALRVPAPARLRPGLWAPWRLRSWRFVSGSVSRSVQFVRSAARPVLFALALLFLPWLIALLIGWLCQ
jgi:hypothetical protein